MIFNHCGGRILAWGEGGGHAGRRIARLPFGIKSWRRNGYAGLEAHPPQTTEFEAPLPPHDAIIIGSGPNGLAAAITLARAGKSVLVLERNATVGGSARSAALTLPGFTHDVCSTVQAMAGSSPFFQPLPLLENGLRLVCPATPFAHPLDDGAAAVCERSIDATAAALGGDGESYRRLMQGIFTDWPRLIPMVLGPIRVPTHPLVLARFGLAGMQSACALADRHFRGPHARALFAGAAAHSMLPLHQIGTAAFGLLLIGSAHAGGWPVARGGSQKLADALAAYLQSLGGEIRLNTEVKNMDDLPPARATLWDITPRQFLAVAGHRLTPRYTRTLRRFAYGPGVFKLDWALREPIPWRAEVCRRAGTLHVGGTLEEIAAAEAASWRHEHAEKPFVLLVQPTVFDASRAPAGRHTAWAYCHVPNGSTLDMTQRMEDQVERFAPGFRDIILARNAMNCEIMEAHNPNIVGGDINGGAQTMRQTIFRPTLFPSPYATSLKGTYLCSASTPPGGGVHGMCGYHAAKAALRRWR